MIPSKNAYKTILTPNEFKNSFLRQKGAALSRGKIDAAPHTYIIFFDVLTMR
jgi:hypothetical protein